jgi:hypothetical protein
MEAVAIQCGCGGVELNVTGTPILGAACYCADCQEGARRIEALEAAPRFRDAHGGTPYLLFRKDRVRTTRGGELLQSHRLGAESPTRRVVAGCCNTAMYLDFTKGHWLSLYRARFGDDAPPLHMRIFTKEKAGEGALPDDLPNYPAFPLGFIARLMRARLAMMFGR